MIRLNILLMSSKSEYLDELISKYVWIDCRESSDILYSAGRSMSKASINAYIEVAYEGHTILLNIWNSSGQEQYDRLRRLSYNGMDCFVVVIHSQTKESYIYAHKTAMEIRKTATETKTPILFAWINKKALQQSEYAKEKQLFEQFQKADAHCSEMVVPDDRRSFYKEIAKDGFLFKKMKKKNSSKVHQQNCSQCGCSIY